jgi:transcriptional regulator with XRE-family HTH domain
MKLIKILDVIEHTRKQAEMTKEELSANSGKSLNYYGQITNNKPKSKFRFRPSLHAVADLCDVLGIEIEIVRKKY